MRVYRCDDVRFGLNRGESVANSSSISLHGIYCTRVRVLSALTMTRQKIAVESCTCTAKQQMTISDNPCDRTINSASSKTETSGSYPFWFACLFALLHWRRLIAKGHNLTSDMLTGASGFDWWSRQMALGADACSLACQSITGGSRYGLVHTRSASVPSSACRKSAQIPK